MAATTALEPKRANTFKLAPGRVVWLTGGTPPHAAMSAQHPARTAQRGQRVRGPGVIVGGHNEVTLTPVTVSSASPATRPQVTVSGAVKLQCQEPGSVSRILAATGLISEDLAEPATVPHQALQLLGLRAALRPEPAGQHRVQPSSLPEGTFRSAGGGCRWAGARPPPAQLSLSSRPPPGLGLVPPSAAPSRW